MHSREAAGKGQEAGRGREGPGERLGMPRATGLHGQGLATACSSQQLPLPRQARVAMMLARYQLAMQHHG